MRSARPFLMPPSPGPIRHSPLRDLHPAVALCSRRAFTPAVTTSTDTLSWRDLPTGVRGALREAGVLAARHGVTLRLFGSFAAGRARRTSDLDVAWSATAPTLPREVREAFERLPTIRPVDLVPLAGASPSLRVAVEREGLNLETLA